jgi:hypothetical protein
MLVGTLSEFRCGREVVLRVAAGRSALAPIGVVTIIDLGSTNS